MDIAELEAEFAGLTLPRFDELTALRLGPDPGRPGAGRRPAGGDRHPHRRPHAVSCGLPGSAPLNDRWARRKSNTALLFQLPRCWSAGATRPRSESLARHGLSSGDYAEHGGAVPIRVAGVGVVAVATVSGLPQVEDHRLVVRGIRALMEAPLTTGQMGPLGPGVIQPTNGNPRRAKGLTLPRPRVIQVVPPGNSGSHVQPCPPPSRIQQKNREVILDAALEVFSLHGFRGATLDQIAEVAGLSKPNLLYYFPSKEAVHKVLLTGLLDTWLDPLRAMDPAGEPLHEIMAYVRPQAGPGPRLSARKPALCR